MKVFTMALMAGCATVSVPAHADPEFNGVYVARVGSKPADVILERQVSKIKTRLKALGFGGADVTYTVSGARSSVRLPSGNISLIVRYPDDGNDPMGIFTVSKAKVRKDNREFGGFKTGLFSLSPDSKEAQPVQYTAVKYKANMMRLVLPATLPPGEYCGSTTQTFTNVNPATFCFGID